MWSEVVVYSLMFCFGIALGGYAQFSLLHCCWDQVRSRAWVEVPSEIISVNPRMDKDGPRSEAAFRYEFDGKTYTSNLIMPEYYLGNSESVLKGLCSELIEFRAAGIKVNRYVNPQNPQESFLYRGGIEWKAVLLVALLGIAAPPSSFVIALFVIYPLSQKLRASYVKIEDRKPWHSRLDWIQGRMRTSNRWLPLLVIAGGVAGLPCILPCMMDCQIALSLSNPDVFAYAGFLFALVPVGTIIVGVVLYRRWQRYGDSVLHLVKNPGVLGGSFAALLRVDQKINPEAGILARLACMEGRQTGFKENQMSYTSIWDSEQTITRDLQTDEHAGSNIPIVFNLPYGLRPTDETDRKLTYTWQLSVSANTNQIPYFAQFDIPVFYTEESDPHFVPDEELMSEYVASEGSLLPLHQAKVKLEELVPHGLRLTFQRSVSLFDVVAISAFCIVFYLGLLWVFAIKFPPVVPVIALVAGIAVTVFLLDAFLFHSQVEVQSKVLRVRRGLLFLGASQEIPGIYIAAFVEQSTIFSFSNLPCYSIYALLKDGKKVTLAKRVASKKAVDMLKQRISDALV